MTYDEVMNYIKGLEEDIKEGRKHFYIRGRKLSVKKWYDCFIHYTSKNGNYSVYYSIEGVTLSGQYFNIKSSDKIADNITIK